MIKETQIKREISSLERRFKVGDISSGYKLYDLYQTGIYEKNPEGQVICLLEKKPRVAQDYLNQCEVLLRSEDEQEKSRLHVTRLILSDFRKFKTLKVRLDENLTVIIGDNGSGKTTIIDGITKALSWLSASIIKKNGVGRRVTDYDVNINSLSFSEVTLQASLNKNTKYSVSLYKTAKGAKDSDTKNSKLEAFDELGSLYRTVDNHRRSIGESEINLPLIVSYSVNRTNIKSNKTFDLEKISSVEIGSKYDVYENKSIDGTGNFDEFSEWFLALYNKSGGDLEIRLDNSMKRLGALVSAGADQESSEIFDIYQNAKNELDSLQKDYSNRRQYIKSLQIVKKAIISTVPGFSDIFIDKSSGRAELKVNVDGREINIFQSSQGQHVFMSMIADISKKLVTLNPEMDNPLHGQGIVLIDEVELHLHPKWQQNIVESLTSTFPNIQFIVTTHSPQVLSTVDKSCIRCFVYDERGNVNCTSPRFQTKGVRSADILAEIMGTSSIPDVEEAHDVDLFSELLLIGNKSEAINLFNNKLKKHFGADHPVILDCQNKVSVFEMKERINLRKKRDSKNEKPE